MASKVKLRYKDRGKPVPKEQVLQTAAIVLKAPFTRLFDTGDGYKAICRNNDDADKILSNLGVAEFAKIGITVVTPPEIRAKRSVFIRQLDSSFGKHTAEEIKTELEDKNEWAKVEEVIKISTYTHVLKVRFAETAMADKALSSGMTGFNWSVVPDQIKREEFVNLLCCFSCYKYEEHATANCPDKEQKACSNCAGTGHTFRECPNSDAKGCLNCKREGREGHATHRTLAMACPIKKEKIRDKQEAEKQQEANQQHSTYASIAKQAVAAAQAAAPPPTQPTTISISKKTDYQVLVAILYSHVMNLANPGTFEREMNELLRLNNLPAMKFPANPDSSAALRIQSSIPAGTDITPRLSSTTTDRDTGAAEGTDDHPDADTDSDADSEDTTLSEDVDVCTQDGDREPEPQPTASDLGLKLYFGKRQPRKFDEPMLIANDIQTGAVKFTYTDSAYSSQQVTDLIGSGRLQLQRDDFSRMDSRTFSQMTSGLTPASPSPQQAEAAAEPPVTKKSRQHR